jgi:hypothetical protein
LCRKEFTIPQNGLEELPKNIFIGKLLTMKEMSKAPSTQLCDWCIAQSKSPANQNEAKTFCVDCQESLCESCVETHSKMKLCRSHRVMDIEDRVYDATTVCLPTKCDKHPNDDLRLFCIGCKEALCVICFATKHTGHESAEIEKVANEFRSEIRGNISQLECGVDCLAYSLSTLQTERRDIVDQFVEVEAKVCSRADELKSLIERHKQQLIEELTKLKADRLKEIDTLVHDATQNKALIESLKKYSEELLKKGSDGDIAREIKLMHLRVEEMRQFYESDSTKTSPDTNMKFLSSGTKLDTSCNTVGRLEIAGIEVFDVTSSDNCKMSVVKQEVRCEVVVEFEKTKILC